MLTAYVPCELIHIQQHEYEKSMCSMEDEQPEVGISR